MSSQINYIFSHPTFDGTVREHQFHLFVMTCQKFVDWSVHRPLGENEEKAQGPDDVRHQMQLILKPSVGFNAWKGLVQITPKADGRKVGVRWGNHPYITGFSRCMATRSFGWNDRKRKKTHDRYRGNWARFIYWFWGHDGFIGQLENYTRRCSGEYLKGWIFRGKGNTHLKWNIEWSSSCWRKKYFNETQFSVK